MGRGQNGIGNRELKELMCTTHGHELRGVGNAGMLEGGGGMKGVGNWENCNSIINKIYYKKECFHVRPNSKVLAGLFSPKKKVMLK